MNSVPCSQNSSRMIVVFSDFFFSVKSFDSKKQTTLVKAKRKDKGTKGGFTNDRKKVGFEID